MAEYGIVGVILLLVLLFYLFFCLSHSVSQYKAPLLGAFISLLVMAFFSYPLRNPYTLGLTVIVILGILSLPYSFFSKRCCLYFYLLLVVVCGYIAFDNGICGRERIARRQWYVLQAYFKEGKFKKILPYYTVLYPYLKKEPSFLFEYGQCLSKSGHYVDSNNVLFEGIHRSCDPMFFNIIGRNYQYLNSPKQAERFYFKAYYRIPHKIYPLYLLMKLYKEQGEYQKCRMLGEAALRQKMKVQSSQTKYVWMKIKELLDSLSS